MIVTNNNYGSSAQLFGYTLQDLPAPVVGEAHEAFEAVDTLHCLTALDFVLIAGKANRKSVLDKLVAIWAGAKSYTGSLEEKKKELFGMITRGFRFFPGCLKYYGPQIDAIQSEEDFQSCLHTFSQDAKSILFASPLVRSCRGNNGPTFLVSYPRLDSNFENPKLQNYVIKWTHWNEVCSTRLYDVFSKQCANLFSGRLDFLVPKASVFDETSGVYEMDNCSKEELTIESAQKFRDKFDGIRLALCPDKQPNDHQIMMIERVAGSNLYDFAKKKYKGLSSEQKKELYVGLGRLAMLDVFMGNTDRLIQINNYRYDPIKGVELVAWEANLGNIMIVTSEQGDDLRLHAIDNGIEPRLIDDPEYNKAYNVFLKQHFKDQNMPETLVKFMTPSIIKDVKVQFSHENNENPKLREEIGKDLELFIEDLEGEDAQSEMLAGLTNMSNKLTEALLPFWESKESNSLKQYLFETHSKLLDVISGRFEILKSFKRS